ncbi:MAG: ATP-binding protein [Clostridia bacterium]|nr:ATP-binding protein [Clostridia bacterium]
MFEGIILITQKEVSVISYSIDVRKKVKEFFDEKQKKAIEEAQERRNEVHLRVPGIAEIDDALAKTGLKVYAEALKKGNPVPLEDRIEALHEENRELQSARADILKEAGYSADYTKPRYECKKCNDTGYVGIDPCECLIKALRRESYLNSGLGAMLTDQSFENFDTSLYPEKSRKMMEFILSQTKKYAEDFGKEDCGKNIMFYGGTGLGKTHLSTAVAKKLIDRGFYVVYDTALNIMHTFERERFSKIDVPVTTDKYFECDLLIIDDLGSEFANSFTHATLYNILNTRLCADKGTVISTNLSSIDAMRKAYDERIVSRVIGSYRSFGFVGEDIRLNTRKQNLSGNK